MRALKCQQCGSLLQWNGKDEILKCEYCGAEYLMHPRRAERPSDPHIGYGEVMGIPMAYYEGMNFEGMLPIDAYVPEGWYAICCAPDTKYYADYCASPLVLEGRFISPDDKALVLFRSNNAWTDKRRSQHMQTYTYPIDFLGTNMRIGKPFDARTYCDTLLKRDALPTKAFLIREDGPDEDEKNRMEQVRQNYIKQGFGTVSVDWKRRVYKILSQEGDERRVAVETRVVDVHRAEQKNEPEKKGFMGALKKGVAAMLDVHMWETQYEMVLITTPELFDKMYAEFRKINLSIRFRSEYNSMKAQVVNYLQSVIMQTQQNVQTAQLNMMQQQQASWERRSKIIQDTNNYTTNVMREMNANTAATHDRVANLQSEAIRGVNTYYTAPGTGGYGRPDVVEASVNWDNVYQSTKNPDFFVATEGSYLEPGVDFELLHKTNGNY